MSVTPSTSRCNLAPAEGEPAFAVNAQGWLWSVGFALFALLAGGLGIMVWHGWETDSTRDPAAVEVLDAFEAAQEAQKSTADCYRAGVAAWRRVHPEQTPVYSAQRAVSLILAVKATLHIPDE